MSHVFIDWFFVCVRMAIVAVPWSLLLQLKWQSHVFIDWLFVCVQGDSGGPLEHVYATVKWQNYVFIDWLFVFVHRVTVAVPWSMFMQL